MLEQSAISYKYTRSSDDTDKPAWHV